MKSATTKSAAAIMLISFQLAAIAANDPLTQQEKHNRDETARSLAIELAARDTVAIKSLVQDQSGKYQVTLERIGPKSTEMRSQHTCKRRETSAWRSTTRSRIVSRSLHEHRYFSSREIFARQLIFQAITAINNSSNL